MVHRFRLLTGIPTVYTPQYLLMAIQTVCTPQRLSISVPDCSSLLLVEGYPVGLQITILIE